jgi:hypothetical protein
MAIPLFLVIFFGLLFFGLIWAHFDDKRLYRLGIYPKEKPTMKDVQRLARNGNMDLATRAYKTITRCSFKEAEEAVEHIIPPEEARRLGAYPKGTPTMEDVKRLAFSGNIKLARRAYRAINGFSFFKAGKVVEQIIIASNKK